jgi:RHS repeat-associated protein
VYSPDAPYSPAARVDAVIAGAMAAAAIDTAKRAARIYHFHTDLVGAPQEVTDESGELAWTGQYSAWGKVEGTVDGRTMQRIEQPLRYAGQYADESVGLHYNTFRFYDPDVGRFVNADPTGLIGGNNLYAYAPNANGWIDPLGWISETAPGYNVYGLYEPGATKPYYIGMTDDLTRRQIEHAASGRLGIEDEMRPLERNVTYGQARGYEQAYIEHYGTKTATIGEPISAMNRGNKINSFDHASTTREPGRQSYFEDHYKAKSGELKGGC